MKIYENKQAAMEAATEYQRANGGFVQEAMYYYDRRTWQVLFGEENEDDLTLGACIQVVDNEDPSEVNECEEFFYRS